ncbi:MAG TPA: hypothetical protein PK230_00005 [Chitinophagales bacterium]|nr:hypothetical protein [Chitinophagales bacterium]
MTASGGSSYSWTGPNSFTSSTQNPTINSATTTNNGTYTVSVSDANGCIFTATTQVSITALPTPTLSSSDADNTICAGQSVTFTGGGGTHYQFYVNGTPQGTYSTTNTFTTTSLTNGQSVTVQTCNDVIFDGTINETAWGSPIATSAGGPAPSTGFGTGHETNALYVAGGNNNDIYLGLAGNVQNGNRILVFIDSKSGGYNTANFGRSGAPGGINTFNSGTTFDTGFNADYCLVIGTNSTHDNYFYDLFALTVSGSNTYLGDNSNAKLEGHLSPTSGSNTQGFEVAIPKASLGYTSGQIKFFVAYISDGGFLNNKFLTPAGSGDGNYGSGAVAFGSAAPNPITVNNIDAVCCNTSSGIATTVNPLPVATASSNSPVCAGSTINLSSGPNGMGNYSWSGPSSYSLNSISYTQNFNSFGTTNVTWTDNSTLAGWYAEKGTGTANFTAGAAGTFTAGTGTGTTGSYYNFGASGGADRTLGSLATNTITGSTGTAAINTAFRYGVKITNTNSFPLNAATITYTGEQWRDNGNTTPQYLDVEYSTDATTNLSTGTWTAVSALRFTGPIASATATALDGNLPANRTTITYALTGINIPAGGSFWIRWIDYNEVGNDHALGIDDLSVFLSAQNPSIPNATTAMTGTYTVTVTDGAGCSSTATTTVVVNPLPTITTAASATAVCFSSSSQTTTLAYSATTNSPTTYSITWNASPANSFATVTDATLPASPITITVPASTAAGTYTGNITVKNANGCVSTSTAFTLTVNPTPTATAPSNQTYCAGVATTAISLTGTPVGVVFDVTGGAAIGLANQTNVTSIPVFTPIAGSATISITPKANGCTGTPVTYNITVNALPAATVTYTSSPVCVNGSTISPTVTGTTGGTYSASPAGLSINSSTGVITPASSTVGTYTVTYTIAASGGCPVVTTTTTVVIKPIPSATITSSDADNSICVGESITFTAGGGTHYQFSVAGTPQGTYGTTNTFTTSSLTNGQSVSVQVCNDVIFDGNFTETTWGTAYSTSAGGPASGFANNRINALYLASNSTQFNFGIAGNVDNNSGNKVLLFIDSQTGGYNDLSTWTNRSGSPYYSVQNLNNGIVFDSGFAPDYVVGINQASGQVYFDLYNMQANTNTFLGTAGSTGLAFTANTSATDYTKGFEFAINRTALGSPTDNIRVFAMVVNDPGCCASTTLSNQFLSPAASGDGNYGNGAVNFGSAAPNPVTLSTSTNVCCSTASLTIVVSTPPTTTGTTICQGGSGTIAATSTCGGAASMTLNGAWNAATDPVADRPVLGTNSGACAFLSPGAVRNYVTMPFQVTVTGNYIFEMANNASYDGEGYIVSADFTPGQCPGTGGTGTWYRNDSDSSPSGDEPRMGNAADGGAGVLTLTAGVSYMLVSTTYGSTGGVTAPFTWNVTGPAGAGIVTDVIQWYTAASGGSPIGTGSPFNPVGVSGSGLPNTNTPGTYTYYAACSSAPSCRTATTFVINPAATANAGTAQSVCADSTVTLAGSIGGSATSATWSAPSGTFSDVNSLTSTYTPSITSGTVTLTLTTNDPDGAGPCTGVISTVDITVNAVPTTTGVTICQGGSGTISSSTTCPPSFANAGTTITGTWNAATDPTAKRITSNIINTNTCSFDASITRNYVATSFQVSTTGNYVFEMNNDSNFDGMGYIVTGAFVPGTCPGAGTWVRGDDDSGSSASEPKLGGTGGSGAMPLTAGVTYTLISTTWAASSGTYSGNFTWTITPPVGGQIMLQSSGQIQWYTAASGGSPIGTGSPFNPVGVSGSGLPNTNTPGTYTYYAACSASPNCRTATTFVINPAATANAGSVQTVCAGGTVTLAGSIGGSATSATWSAPSGTFSDVNSLTSTYTPSITSGTVTLTLTTNDPDGAGPCSAATSTVVITVNPIPTATASNDSPVCVGGTVNLTSSGGTSYSWTGPNTFSSATQNPTITNIPLTGAGVYTVTVTAAGCSSTATTTVDVVADPTITVQPLGQTVCLNASTNLTTSVTGGTGTTTYQWQSAADCNSTFSNITGANTNTYVPPTATASTTAYRCVITISGSGCDTQITNCVLVTVTPQGTISVTVQPGN